MIAVTQSAGAEIADTDRIAEGGGAASEHEDIRKVWMSLGEVRVRVANGGIHDAKTLIALQWLLGTLRPIEP